MYHENASHIILYTNRDLKISHTKLLVNFKAMVLSREDLSSMDETIETLTQRTQECAEMASTVRKISWLP